MRAIVLVDDNWGIGFEGEQVLYLKNDLKRFVRLTKGHVVILGRKTLATFPGGQPLKGRTNLILSRTLDPSTLEGEDVRVMRSVDELLAELQSLQAEGYLKEEFFVLGGASLYQELYPYCDRIDVTHVATTRAADKHFPNVAEDPAFKLTEVSREFSGVTREGEEVRYVYRSYERQSPGDPAAASQ